MHESMASGRVRPVAQNRHPRRMSFLFMVRPLTSGSYLDQRSRTIIAVMQFPSQMEKYYFTVGVRLDEDMQTALTQWAIYLLVVAI